MNVKYMLISNKLYKKTRNPNIDFIRVVGMFSIVIHHSLIHGGAFFKYPKNKEIRILNILCMWHVSSFGMISGILRNVHKISNLFYLWITVLFYSLLFYIIFEKFHISIINEKLLSNLFPVVYNKYWYFTSYFGIYPFIPFINSGISSLSQMEVKTYIYFIIGIFFIWTSMTIDSFRLCNGYSTITVLIFYIIGTYLGKYIFYTKYSLKYKYFILLVCLISFLISSILCYRFNLIMNPSNICKKIKNLFNIGIISFPMLIQVLSLIISVSQINFNKIISKIITFIGPLTFDIYLIHENEYIRSNYISKLFNNVSNSIKYIQIIVIKKSLYIYFVCIFIAYIRNFIFRILRIKNISKYFETTIFKLNN